MTRISRRSPSSRRAATRSRRSFSCAPTAPRCRGWAVRCRSTRRACGSRGASRPRSRTCRAGSCSDRRSTTRSGCSIFRSSPLPLLPRHRRRRAAPMPRRACSNCPPPRDSSSRRRPTTIRSSRRTSRVNLRLTRRRAPRVCKTSPAATRGFSSRLATRRSAAMRTAIRSPAKSATARSRSSSCPTNWALPSSSARSSSPSAR